MRWLSCLLLIVAASAADVLTEAQGAVAAGDPDRARRILLLALAQELPVDQRTSVEALLLQIQGRTTSRPGAPATTEDLLLLRQRVAPLLMQNDLDGAGRAAINALRAAAPDDPLLAQVSRRFAPRWADATGIDAHGRWASLRLGRLLVRFRLIPAGVQELGSGRELKQEADCWLAETETSTALIGALRQIGHAGAVDAQPAADLSTEEALALLQILTQILPAGVRARLPTPTEWEYAARAGHRGALLPDTQSGGNAVLEALSPAKASSPTGNAWGLCDMQGSLWEMVRDDHGQLWRRGGGWRSDRTAAALDRIEPVPRWRGDPGTGFRILIAEPLP